MTFGGLHGDVLRACIARAGAPKKPRRFSDGAMLSHRPRPAGGRRGQSNLTSSKYGVGLTMAHQYLAQLNSDDPFGSLRKCGTLISSCVGAEDAPFPEVGFLPQFDARDLVNLSNRNVHLNLMLGGAPNEAFSAETILFENVLVHHREAEATEPLPTNELMSNYL